ncbi:signal peptidase I [Ruminococcus flavefaciens]|uniref:Signal peptidase I n=1 Tax=Ruminococcus flavefaciens TaxID=1265 RepID=A0A1K1PF66_RUMFL|nr:signal peptidase I [Ruminococcus flavefaciens]
MSKKEFGDLNKRELVDLVYTMMTTDEEKSSELPPVEQVEAERSKLDNKAKFRRILKSTVSALLVVAAAAVLISMLFLPVIQVSGDSMKPTLSNGDIILLVKSKRFSTGELCCVSWQNKLLLKRVIGLPGDNIDIDENGNVYLNGKLLDEPYVTNKALGECDIDLPYTVPEGKLFVMGDQRETSVDSRSTAVGCVDYDQMVGRYLFRIWSAE